MYSFIVVALPVILMMLQYVLPSIASCPCCYPCWAILFKLAGSVMSMSSEGREEIILITGLIPISSLFYRRHISRLIMIILQYNISYTDSLDTVSSVVTDTVKQLNDLVVSIDEKGDRSQYLPE